jgi:hypothetical protein
LFSEPTCGFNKYRAERVLGVSSLAPGAVAFGGLN